ncbi:MAG: bacteriocin [Pseudomonadota bacterium]
MKKTLLAVALIAGLAGCTSTREGDRALVGGAIGAATGATIAAATGASAGGTIAAATVGAAGGAVVGAATTPRRRCVNRFGDPVRCP